MESKENQTENDFDFQSNDDGLEKENLFIESFNENNFSTTTNEDDDDAAINTTNEDSTSDTIPTSPTATTTSSSMIINKSLTNHEDEFTAFDFDEDNTESSPLDNENSRPCGVIDFFIDVHEFPNLTKEKKAFSDSVIVRCLPWRIMIMNRKSDNAPNNYLRDQLRSNNNKSMTFGFFLQCNPNDGSNLWTCHATAQLSLIARDGFASHHKIIVHTFHAKENDWGFTNFISYDELFNPQRGFITTNGGSGSLIHLRVRIRADAPHGANWDSKKYTGFVGILNQGATCYMNSLLQAFYFTNKLRKAVYEMPTDPNDRHEITLSLQWLFFDLQHSHHVVDTKRLTRSFGWKSSDTFMQHDVQELCRVLLENLEKRMRGTVVSDTIPNLFCGKMLSYIRCKNVPVVSEHEENFYDIQLKVKDNTSIYDAFKDYIAVETLDQDNLYNAEEHGLQEAEKGVIFLTFPPVLYLQLMRFHYDPEFDAYVKINDRFEFPYNLNLDPYLKDKGSDPANYFLHAVLVHSGDQYGGHYVIYINPHGDGHWYKFNDDVVSSSSAKEAIQGNYGGFSRDNEIEASKCSSNAYMLVYIRESAKSDVLLDVTDQHIPQWMKETSEHSFKQTDKDQQQNLPLQQQHQQQQQQIQQHLLQVNLILEEDFHYWQGYHVCECLPNRPVSYSPTANYSQFIHSIADSVQKNPNYIRLWILKTNPRSSSHYYVEWLSPKRYFTSVMKQVWLEELKCPSATIGGGFNNNDDCLIFIKYFETEENELYYAGHEIVSRKSSSLIKSLEKYYSPVRSTDVCFYFENDRECNTLAIQSPNNSLDDCLSACNLQSDESGFVVIIQTIPTHQRIQSLLSSRANSNTITSLSSSSLPLTSVSPSPSPPSTPSTTTTTTTSTLSFSSTRSLLHEMLNNYYEQSRNTVRILFMDRQKLLESIHHGSTTTEPTTISELHLSQHPLVVGDHATLSHLKEEYGAFVKILHRNISYWRVVDFIAKRISRIANAASVAAGGVDSSNNSGEDSLKINKEFIQLFTASIGRDKPVGSDVACLQDILIPTRDNTLSVGHHFCLFDDNNTNVNSAASGNNTIIPSRGHKITCRIFYQILNLSIDRIEAMLRIIIVYVPPNLQEELELLLCLPPKATVSELLFAASQHPLVNASDVDRPHLRLWEVANNNLTWMASDHNLILDDILLAMQHRHNKRFLRVDFRPPDERSMTSDDKCIRVAHFHHDVFTGMHGIPFTVRVCESDLMREIAERIRLRLNVSIKEFSKWKLSLVYNDVLQAIDLDERWSFYLRSYRIGSVNQNPLAPLPMWIALEHRFAPRRSVEKAIVIPS